MINFWLFSDERFYSAFQKFLNIYNQLNSKQKDFKTEFSNNQIHKTINQTLSKPRK